MNNDPIKSYEAIFANYNAGEIFNQTGTDKLVQAINKIRTEGVLLCPFSDKIDRYYSFHGGIICVTTISMQETKKAICINISHDHLKQTYGLCERLGFTNCEK